MPALRSKKPIPVRGIPLSLVNPQSALTLAGSLGVVGTLLSLILGGLGGVIGIMLGRSVGATTRTLER